MKVLICGSRDYRDYKKIYDFLSDLKKQYESVIVVEGGNEDRLDKNKSADYLAKVAAEKLGLEVREYKADWKSYGRAAGPKRNKKMLEEEKPDLVVAFHEDIEKSKGTKDMVKQSEKAGVEVVRFN